jgi:hypothetical protein
MNYNSKWLNYAIIVVIIGLFYYHKTFTNIVRFKEDMPIDNSRYTLKVDLSKKNEDRSIVERFIYSMVDDDIKRRTNPEAYKDALPQVGRNDLIVLDIKSETELSLAKNPNFIGPLIPEVLSMFTMGAHQLDADWEEQIKGMRLGEIKMISTTTGKYRVQIIDIKKINK